MKERGELLNEEGDAVRENRTMHEENFWSSWLRENVRGREERVAKAEKNEEEKGEKGKEKRRSKGTKRGQSKEDVRIVFRWRPLVKRETWVSCGGLSWEDLLEKPEDLSDCEPDSCAHVRVVPVVTDVLVSPSSVVTEFCWFVVGL